MPLNCAVADEIEPELAEVLAAVEHVQRQVDGLASQMRESHAENKRKFDQILALLDNKSPMMQTRQQAMSTVQYDEQGRVFVPETPGMSAATPAHGRRHTPKLNITHGTNLWDTLDGVPPQFAHMSAAERAAKGKELRDREDELRSLRAGHPSPVSIGSLSVGASSNPAAREDLAKIVASVIPFPELK